MFNGRSSLVVMKDNPWYGAGKCVNCYPFFTRKLIDDETFYIVPEDGWNAESARCMGRHKTLKHGYLCIDAPTVQKDEWSNARRYNPQFLQGC